MPEQHEGEGGEVGGQSAPGHDVQLGDLFELGRRFGNPGVAVAALQREPCAAAVEATPVAPSAPGGTPVDVGAERRCGASARRS